MTRKLSALAAATVAFALAGTAAADSTPVGKLPRGPVHVVTTERGQYVAAALPKLALLDWRIARTVDGGVLRQVSEGEIGNTVVVVFRAVGKGKATVSFAATRGDASPKAERALFYRVTVR